MRLGIVHYLSSQKLPKALRVGDAGDEERNQEWVDDPTESSFVDPYMPEWNLLFLEYALGPSIPSQKQDHVPLGEDECG